MDADKKKKLQIAGLIGVIVIAIVAIMLLNRGPSDGSSGPIVPGPALIGSSGSPMSPMGAPPQMPGAPTMGAAGPSGPKMPQVGMGGGMPGMGGATGSSPKGRGTSPGTGGPVTLASARISGIRSRKDPFAPLWQPPKAPPPSPFNYVDPVRVAPEPDPVDPTQPESREVNEQALVRVPGIVSGNGVAAMLERPDGTTDIVKPGSEVEFPIGNGSGAKRTYRVESISSTAVTLVNKTGGITYRQVINIGDEPAGFGSGGSSPVPAGGP